MVSETMSEFSRAALSRQGPRPPSSFVFFYGHGESAGENRVFSNWYEPTDGEIRDESGICFRTTEHYMMWRKAKLFGDEEASIAVLCADTPKQAKAIGRKVRGFDDDIWKMNARMIVADGCMLKFEKDEVCKKRLLETGEKILVEASPRDRLWGIGMGVGNPNRLDPRQWRGENWLGEVLMDVRARIVHKQMITNAREGESKSEDENAD